MAVSMQKIVYLYGHAHSGTQSMIIHVQKFCTFDCYDSLPVLKQEVRFAAHEFHVALVDEQG